MNSKVEIITVEVTRSHTGLYTATSDALDGVYMAHADKEQIIADLPAVVRRWFKNNRNVDVDVFTRSPVAGHDDGFYIPAIPVPVEVAAQSLRR
jgi:hypothetical protein